MPIVFSDNHVSQSHGRRRRHSPKMKLAPIKARMPNVPGNSHTSASPVSSTSRDVGRPRRRDSVGEVWNQMSPQRRKETEESIRKDATTSLPMLRKTGEVMEQVGGGITNLAMGAEVASGGAATPFAVGAGVLGGTVKTVGHGLQAIDNHYANSRNRKHAKYAVGASKRVMEQGIKDGRKGMRKQAVGMLGSALGTFSGPGMDNVNPFGDLAEAPGWSPFGPGEMDPTLEGTNQGRSHKSLEMIADNSGTTGEDALSELVSGRSNHHTPLSATRDGREMMVNHEQNRAFRSVHGRKKDTGGFDGVGPGPSTLTVGRYDPQSSAGYADNIHREREQEEGWHKRNNKRNVFARTAMNLLHKHNR